MRLFKRGENKSPGIVQMRSKESHPFSILDGYVPLSSGELRLYRAIREAVPVIDAAVVKLIRLTGGVSAVCTDKQAERGLKEFLETVPVGRGQRGINAFLDCYMDSLITCGRAVGEIVLSQSRRAAALVCGDVENIRIKEGESPLSFKLCAPDESGEIKELPYQELLIFTPYNPEAANPYGVSLMRSMPFLTDILMKIYNALGLNWDRAGNVRFSVVYRPKGDVVDRAYARERAEQMAKEWSSAMQSTKSGAVKDFVAVGDVDIKVIGADGQILDSEVPVRQIMEQLVARTGIPPFMLGLSWSSTERMSSQQADLLTSEITAIRRSLEPAILRICDIWLRTNGYSCRTELRWDDINLQDETEEAHAELYRAQAEYYRAEAERIKKEMKVGDEDH
ncbi:MAG: serine/threonine protein phosphatase [Oscillospiraceae bacterium]